MKASELMQGDVVLYEYDGEKIYARVVEIYGSSALIESVGKEYEPIEIAEDNLFPIVITPEILEKNRFISDNISPYYLPIKDGSVRFSKHQYGLYCNILRILRPYQRYDGVCSCVHQLQHGLRLCGIEKEIEL